MRKDQLLLNFSIAFILSITIISICLAFSNAIYSGPLHNFLPWGTRLMLFSASIVILIIAGFSSVPIVVARPQDEPLPLLLIMIQGLIIQIAAGNTNVLTVVVAIVITTVMTGVFLFIIGYFKLGNFVRYVPFPVVTGFLASTGLLLILHALQDVMPFAQLSITSLKLLVSPHWLSIWVPAVVFGFIAFLLTEKRANPLIFPSLLFISVGLFYLIAFLSGQTIQGLRNQNYLIPRFDDVDFTLRHLQFDLSAINTIDWHLIHNNLITMFLIALISVMALLFITISLELILRKDIDFNRELKIAGVANMIGGAFGGIVGYHGLGNTVFAASFKTQTRAVGIITGIICGLAVFFAGQGIGFFPKFLLSGLIFFLGLSLFYSWTFRVWHRLDPLDKGVVLTVLLVTLFFGFLQGIISGILISILFFIFTYSRVNVVRYVVNGGELTSTYERDPIAQKIIKANAEKLSYIKLEGYLFFGSANGLVNLLHKLDSKDNPLSYIIYDFERVTGIDSSVEMSFEKIREYAHSRGLTVIVTGYEAANNQNLITKISKLRETSNFIKIPDKDAAINYCEIGLINDAGFNLEELENQVIILQDFLNDKLLSDKIIKYFEDVELKANEYLVHQGEFSYDLFYLESGRLGIYLKLQDGTDKIIANIGPGNIIGEIAFYLHSSRSASIIAQKDCKLKKLSQKNLKRMDMEEPELADAFHQAIICLLSEKLLNSNKKLEILVK